MPTQSTSLLGSLSAGARTPALRLGALGALAGGQAGYTWPKAINHGALGPVDLAGAPFLEGYLSLVQSRLPPSMEPSGPVSGLGIGSGLPAVPWSRRTSPDAHWSQWDSTSPGDYHEQRKNSRAWNQRFIERLAPDFAAMDDPFALTLSACIHPRALTTNEQSIRVEPNDPETTARLLRECKVVATPHARLITDAEHVFGGLAGAFTGEHSECAGEIKDRDDLIRCIGEHQAQVGQVTDVKYKMVTRGAVPLGVGLHNSCGSMEQCWVRVSRDRDRGRGVVSRSEIGSVRPVATDADLRFWKCPASRGRSCRASWCG